MNLINDFLRGFTAAAIAALAAAVLLLFIAVAAFGHEASGISVSLAPGEVDPAFGPHTLIFRIDYGDDPKPRHVVPVKRRKKTLMYELSYKATGCLASGPTWVYWGSEGTNYVGFAGGTEFEVRAHHLNDDGTLTLLGTATATTDGTAPESYNDPVADDNCDPNAPPPTCVIRSAATTTTRFTRRSATGTQCGLASDFAWAAVRSATQWPPTRWLRT